MTRVPVVLHERLGHWARQLRPRLSEQPIRWFESRSRNDLEVLLTGLAFPVVLIDLGRAVTAGLEDLGRVVQKAPNARALVLDLEARPGVAELARELGATHVFSGFVPPPAVAELIARWVGLAGPSIERAGWSRTTFPETRTDPWSWLADYLGEPAERGPRPAAGHPIGPI